VLDAETDKQVGLAPKNLFVPVSERGRCQTGDTVEVIVATTLVSIAVNLFRAPLPVLPCICKPSELDRRGTMNGVVKQVRNSISTSLPDMDQSTLQKLKEQALAKARHLQEQVRRTSLLEVDLA